MNTEEYISSGILESYVLDQLSNEERLAVEKLMAENEEIRSEIEAIERSIETLALSTSLEVPLDTDDLLPPTENKSESPVISLPRKSEGYLRIAVAASIFLAIGSSILAGYYWNKWQSTESRLAEVIAQNDQFAENFNKVNQELETTRNSVAIMSDENFSRVVMNGTENSPSALATVYWNQSSQQVYLNVQQLGELSEAQQYQLWAIIDGKPVDAGVFDLTDSQEFLKMKAIGSGVAAFAVTIEPKGGSENPTLETMQVIGNV